MKKIYRGDNGDNFRQVSRVEKNEIKKENEVFTLSEENYNLWFNLLNTNDMESLNEAISMFSRHYLYNSFFYNEKTHVILTVAVSILNNVQTHPNDLAKKSFNLISSVVKNSINGLSFILETNILQIFIDNASNINSPFFEQAINSIVCISYPSQAICEMIYQVFNVAFFIDIMKNLSINDNPDLQVDIMWILYFYTKYSFLTKEESFKMIEFLNEIFYIRYKQLKDINLKTCDFEILTRSIRILTLLFTKSALFCDNPYINNFISIFNFILGWNKNEQHARKMISIVLLAFIPLLGKGSALKEPGINIAFITSLIRSHHQKIQIPALDCLNLFIRGCPALIKMLLQTKMLHNLQKIFQNGSFRAKIKSFEIIDLIINYGTSEDKIILLNPIFVNFFAALANEADDEIYLKILQFLNRILTMETIMNHDYHIRSTFLEIDAIQIIESKTMNESDIVSEASQQFIRDHFANV